jgi:hypothetical protein
MSFPKHLIRFLSVNRLSANYMASYKTDNSRKGDCQEIILPPFERIQTNRANIDFKVNKQLAKKKNVPNIDGKDKNFYHKNFFEIFNGLSKRFLVSFHLVKIKCLNRSQFNILVEIRIPFNHFH